MLLDKHAVRELNTSDPQYMEEPLATGNYDFLVALCGKTSLILAEPTSILILAAFVVPQVGDYFRDGLTKRGVAGDGQKGFVGPPVVTE